MTACAGKGPTSHRLCRQWPSTPLFGAHADVASSQWTPSGRRTAICYVLAKQIVPFVMHGRLAHALLGLSNPHSAAREHGCLIHFTLLIRAPGTHCVGPFM